MRCALLGWLALCLAAVSTAPAGAGQQPPTAVGEPRTAAVPAAARALARWAHDSGDHLGLPYVVVDKRAAVLAAYRADGSLVGVSAALIGRTPGDASLTGVGERTQQQGLRPEDLTTPAGRFVSEPGRNLDGEAVIWIDYGHALAIHRLRPGPAWAQRAQRLAGSDAAARRMSAGCVVLPERFYDQVVRPLLGRGRGVVYVLPESGSLPAAAQAAFARRR